MTVRDPGLQPERTSIAWTRTCTALMIVGLIGTRFHAGPFALVVTLSGLVAAALLMLVSARRGKRTEHELSTGRVTPAVSLAAALTALVVLLDVTAALMIWLYR